VTDIHGEVPSNGVRSGSLQTRRKAGNSDNLQLRRRTGLRISRGVAPNSAKSAKTAPTHHISNLQASSKLSLTATSAVIVATSIFAGSLYVFISGQKYSGTGEFWATGLLIAVFFCSILRHSEERQSLKPSNIYSRARHAAVAWLTSFAFFLAIAFMFKISAELSRGATVSFFLAGLVTVPISHMRMPILLARLWRPSAFMHRDIILVGACGDPALKRLIAEFHQGGCIEPHIVEFDAMCSTTAWPEECKALLTGVTGLAHQLGPGEIYLAISQIPPSRADSIMRSLALIPRAVLVVPDKFTAQLLRHPVTEVGVEIAVASQKAPMGIIGHAVKHAVDIVLSIAAIVFLAPLFVAIAVAIKCDSPGPILFRQLRNGYQGRTFRILKFRTMTVMEDGEVIDQAQRNDVRTTRVGRWLRKTSLDEIPQFFNVLHGEMSLIGPRPHARAHDAFYSRVIENYEIRQHVKPGITGWAQVNGLRGETQTLDLMYRRIEFDLWYAKNCTILLDFRILARTLLEVMRPRGAY
jgi:undecaprenyl-phosphate galactose phosphotransferase/putative colanic acid biosynthesis UDP-glucose lipid carrier transferase